MSPANDAPAPPPDLLRKVDWLERAKIGKTTFHAEYRDRLLAAGRIWEDPTGGHWLSPVDADRVRAERLRPARAKSGRADRARRACSRCGNLVGSLDSDCHHCGQEREPSD
jgi:hypothetical protein